jgi:hypothetical protein
MADKVFQQIECISMDDKATLTVWVESDQVKPLDRCTFKETGDTQWLVTTVYTTRVTHVNRGWGLNLPKSQRTEV